MVNIDSAVDMLFRFFVFCNFFSERLEVSDAFAYPGFLFRIVGKDNKTKHLQHRTRKATEFSRRERLNVQVHISFLLLHFC